MNKSDFLRYAGAFVFSSMSLSAMADTGYSYYPMSPSRSITYEVFTFTSGGWDSNQMTLGIDASTEVLVANSPQQNTYTSSTCNLFGQLWQGGATAPLYVENVFNANGTFGGSLQNGGGVAYNGVAGEGAGTLTNYIGEAVNSMGQVMVPFEAKLTKNPIAGETIQGYSKVYTSCQNGAIVQAETPDHWTYRTVQHLASWGVFTDVWRTALWEHSTTPGGLDAVYNYIFANGIGLVEAWSGTLHSDGSVTNGVRSYAISY